jgi:hypothetical protein
MMQATIKPERLELIQLSQQAKAIQQQIEVTTGEAPSINSILLKMYEADANTSDFRRFDEWNKAGFKIKRNAKAFRIWGSPKKCRGKTDTDPAPTQDNQTSSEENMFEFFPMCCLFSANQVEKSEEQTN